MKHAIFALKFAVALAIAGECHSAFSSDFRSTFAFAVFACISLALKELLSELDDVIRNIRWR